MSPVVCPDVPVRTLSDAASDGFTTGSTHRRILRRLLLLLGGVGVIWALSLLIHSPSAMAATPKPAAPPAPLASAASATPAANQLTAAVGQLLGGTTAALEQTVHAVTTTLPASVAADLHATAQSPALAQAPVVAAVLDDSADTISTVQTEVLEPLDDQVVAPALQQLEATVTTVTTAIASPAAAPSAAVTTPMTATTPAGPLPVVTADGPAAAAAPAPSLGTAGPTAARPADLAVSALTAPAGGSSTPAAPAPRPQPAPAPAPTPAPGSPAPTSGGSAGPVLAAITNSSVHPVDAHGLSCSTNRDNRINSLLADDPSFSPD